MKSYLDTPIEFIKGVGPQRAQLLQEELGILTFRDMIKHYPFRYEDRSQTYAIKDLTGNTPAVQITGRIRKMNIIGGGRKSRLVARLADESGEIELVWFKGVQWFAKQLQVGVEYNVFGKPNKYGSKLNIAHPEIEVTTRASAEFVPKLQPVYNTSEKLKKKYLDSKALVKIQKGFIPEAARKIPETLPSTLKNQYKLMDVGNAVLNVHFPDSEDLLAKALYRLKFEEFFYIQLKLFSIKSSRTKRFKGEKYKDTDLLTEFYNEHLPFELTGAQKRVIREIYSDMKSGVQMNRLLQGDVGSGKTIVAFICMLIAIGSGSQATLMAPTEILAIQHFNGLEPFAKKVGLRIALLTGSTKSSDKKIIRAMLRDGDLDLIVGTHALIEDKVVFKKLGIAVVDEQHRFGVAQRSKLWQKNKDLFPHVLVMTATPIPRTLAMTLYGDLDVSTIDELPKGRKEIKTIHRYDSNRLRVNQFIRDEIEKGRQVYVVYPLIEESEKMDLKDLMDGYESVSRAFPGYAVSIVHGKMNSEAKEYEMQRFVKGETKIMVATTVIEVGVDVPNASAMIIENAERFGLAQLHQLRGRVGRGAEQSYCILISKYELSKDARTRLETMVRTTNGFEIADVDLQLRGPGDLSGTQQSGAVDLHIADLAKDGKILQVAREAAMNLIDADPELSQEENRLMKEYLDKHMIGVNWSKIS